MIKMETLSIPPSKPVQTSAIESQSESPPSLGFMGRINPSNSYSEHNAIDFAQYRSEKMHVGIFQRNQQSIFVEVTFPSITKIVSVHPESRSSSNPQIVQQIASVLGNAEGFEFDDKHEFTPGDYCFGFVFRSTEEAQAISRLEFNLLIKPVSNLMVAQMLFGLYRSLGFEPSHIMSYPSKSRKSSTPFYRKLRSEINGLVTRLEPLVRSNETKKTEKVEETEKIEESEIVINADKLDRWLEKNMGSSQQIGDLFRLVQQIDTNTQSIQKNLTGVIPEVRTCVKDTIEPIRREVRETQKVVKSTTQETHQVVRDTVEKSKQTVNNSRLPSTQNSTELQVPPKELAKLQEQQTQKFTELQSSLKTQERKLTELHSAQDKKLGELCAAQERKLDELHSKTAELLETNVKGVFERIETLKSSTSLQSVFSTLSVISEQVRKISEALITTQKNVERYPGELEERNGQICQILERVQNELNQLCREGKRSRKEKKSNVKVMSIADVDELIKDRNTYYKKLVEAEDFIEHLLARKALAQADP